MTDLFTTNNIIHVYPKKLDSCDNHKTHQWRLTCSSSVRGTKANGCWDSSCRIAANSLSCMSSGILTHKANLR